MKRTTGFAQFSNFDQREKFYKKITDPILINCSCVASTQPVIIFEDLTEDSLNFLLVILDGLGMWYEDIKLN